MIEIDLIRHVKVSGKAALYGCTDILPMATDNEKLLNRLIDQQSHHPYDEIISSPLVRCQHLANAFSKNCQLPITISPALKEMNFGDYDGVPFDHLTFGNLLFDKDKDKDKDKIDSRTKAEVNLEKPTSDLSWAKMEAFFQAPANVILPNAESLTNFHSRVVSTWQKLLEDKVATLEHNTTKDTQDKSSHQNNAKAPKRILVVVHGGVIRMILAHILQLDWKNPALYQQLHIGNGSLTRVCVSQPAQKENDKKTNLKTQQPPYRELHQQVTTIAMPFLEEI